jgi:hypothetical protein
MPSVASQAIGLNRTSAITAVALGGSFTQNIASFSQFASAANSFSLNQSSEPYQRMVALTQISKGASQTINTFDLSINGTTGVLLGTISNSNLNLYIHYINTPRTSGASTSYSVSLTGPSQTAGSLTIVTRVYMLDGGSGPYETKTGTNSTSHTLGSEDFINNQGAIFAITNDSSMTGITTQANSPTTGGELVSAGSTVNLSATGFIVSSVFK